MTHITCEKQFTKTFMTQLVNMWQKKHWMLLVLRVSISIGIDVIVQKEATCNKSEEKQYCCFMSDSLNH